MKAVNVEKSKSFRISFTLREMNILESRSEWAARGIKRFIKQCAIKIKGSNI